MYKIVGYFSALEIAALIAFMAISGGQGAGVLRYLPLLTAVVVMGCIGYSKSKSMAYKDIAFVSIAVSAIFASAVQLLGFTMYPGLAKDIEFLSGENAARAGTMLLIGSIGNFLLLALVRLAGHFDRQKGR